MKSMYDNLASKGRYGDTELAHVNPQEKAMLKRMGGSGTINPSTGLKEYNPLLAIAATAAVAKFGIDLYSQYKAGSSREDSASDYSGLAQGAKDVYTSNLGQIRQEANLRFENLKNDFNKLTKNLGDKATAATDIGAPTKGFKSFGEQNFAQQMALGTIEEASTQAYQDKSLSEQAVQISTSGQEIEAFQRMEEEVAGFEAEADSAKNDWYFGKGIRGQTKNLFKPSKWRF